MIAFFRCLLSLSAFLALIASGLALPASETTVEKVDDVWHPITTLDETLVGESGAKQQEDDDKTSAKSASDDDDVKVKTVLRAIRLVEDSQNPNEDNGSTVNEASVNGSTDDFFYNYEYPLYDTQEVPENVAEGSEASTKAQDERKKRHSVPVVSGQPLQGGTSVQTSGQQQTTGLKLGSAAALSHQQQSSYRHKLQHHRLQDLQSGGVLLSQPKIIVRQQLERGPISTETSQLGYRLQAVVSGNNNQESTEYSPSQQELQQISSTLNPAYTNTNSQVGLAQGTSSRTDAAKVLYVLGLLSKFGTQGSGSSATSQSVSPISTSSGSSYYSLNGGQPLSLTGSVVKLGEKQDFSQLSEIGSQANSASVQRVSIIRLLQPLIRYVAVQKDSPQGQWQSFLEKISNQESTVGYQTLIEQIQSENLRQQRLLQRLQFWRNLATKLKKFQDGLQCVSN
ncbi:uncharacterized protein LOC108683030 [Hyalella azteca]|uniref:Uncharacterized protein LOC108683030 n=1 Tax=Hyalella azteca TaxID=294128 RepID=A0A8B7PP69_HYAAZ|nr:uncharacterized protein LOC108683030 [Hyalella azteca]